MAELVILIGLPGAGKSSFYRDRFAATHLHVSKDLMRNRRDQQMRQLALIDEALATGRSVVVDNVNATAADRAALIDAARRPSAPVRGGRSLLPASATRSASRPRGWQLRARARDRSECDSGVSTPGRSR